ncbi:hypothetical protein MSG28_010401 [Choristoneura fumiferana]|nr:hypothetical protein MSG28_010401 [Choristoneura fumiferana]KAI8437001.1 hypothetical protein MSG28_010401 [Choristoneura fumiferana]
MARGEIGMAAIDLRHPNLVLCQFSDSLLYTHTMTKINYFNPIEIIVPNTFCEGVQPSQLYQLIRDQYPLLNLTTVQRRHFNDAVGRQHIQTLCAPHYSPVFLQILDKFYALTAAAAVLKYVEYIQCVVFARESLKIEYHSSENTMIIDVGTATQLELVQPLLPSAGATCCLLGVLGPTYTVGGIRALRAAILQPSCKKEFIENRLDAVQDLIENESGLMIGLQDVVKKLSDIDRILLLCVEPQNQDMNKMGEAQLNQVQNNGTRVSMTTEELVVLDQQAKESLNEIQKMSNIVIGSLLKDLRPFMSSLYKLCENVAELDILLSIAQASTVGSYTRPDFSNHLDIRNSIHPLLDYNSQTMPVPNDIVGCFLPATNAVLRICDRVFSRIGFNDSVELNASTYVIEMKEIQHILKGLTTSSLVIIDELCRGTSTEEGTSIAWAVCEDLLASDAFIFFTTHFMYLTRLQDLYFNVVNLHTEVREEEMTNSPELQKRLVYEHKIKSGITNIKNYGLSLAAKTNLPSGTIQLAWELAELIDKNRNHQDTNSKFKSDNRLLYELNAAIRKESRRHPNNESFIRNIKIKFKEDNPQLIERLKVQRRRANNYIDTSDNNSSVSNTRQEPSNDGVINSRNSYSSSDQLNRIPLSINRSQQRPIVYTDGDDKENRDLIHNLATTECRGVKSSTELLNTMMHLDNNNINQNPENTNDGDENEDNYFEEARNENFDNDEDDTANNTAFIDGSIIISDVHINEGGLRNDTNDPFTGSDSELAEAMTQIIECSIQTKTKDDSEVSTDEELIKETVNDINMELESVTVSLEDLVLPPPLEFRD